MARFSFRAVTCCLALAHAAQGAPDLPELINAVNYSISAPPGCVDLNSGHAMRSGDPTQWPCVIVRRNAGTDANIPRWPNLLGKTLKVTVDLSNVGCRWNLAFQAVEGTADGRYCDGNCKVPGKPARCDGADNCAEIDFMEANEHVWATTLHTQNGAGGYHDGYAKGYGASRSGMWNYGVNGGSVNTKHPIDLNIGFPVDGNGNLQNLFIGLYQDGDYHPKATFSLNNGGGMGQLTNAVRRGLIPGFSLWHCNNGCEGWFDGPNCNYDYPSGDAYFYNWQVTSGVEGFETLV